MKNFYIILILFLSFTIYSCAKKSDSSSSSSTTTEVEGTWVVSCYASGNYYLIKTIAVTGTSVVHKDEYHSDSSCATDYETWEVTFSSLSIGEAQTFATYGSSGGSGHKFTMTLSTNTFTPHTSGMVSNDNTNSWCGFSGWEINTATSIAGKTCGSNDYWAKDTAIYGKYILDGTKLMPKFTSGSHPSDVSSDTSNTYVKQ